MVFGNSVELDDGAISAKESAVHNLYSTIRSWPSSLGLVLGEIGKVPPSMIGSTLAVIVISPVLASLAPVILKLLIDRLDGLQPFESPYLAASALVVAYVAIQWLYRVAAELRTLAVGRINERVKRTISVKLVRHLTSLPLNSYQLQSSGALNQRISDGLAGTRLVVEHLLATLLPVLVEIGTIGVVLVSVGHPTFILILGVSLVAYAAVFSVGAARLTIPARDVTAAQIRAAAEVTDSILNYEAIKQFTAEERVRQRMNNAFAETESKWSHFHFLKGTNGVLVATVFALSLAATTTMASEEVQLGRMTIGEFVLVHSYVLQVARPMERLGFAVLHSTQGMTFVDNIVGLLNQQPEITRGFKPFVRGPGEIVFDAVSFGHGNGREVLRNLSFRIPAGQTAAIVGPSGAGKTSIIRLLLRLWEPDKGRILIDGTPISEISPVDLRRAISVVPQETLLFSETIAYNIAIGSDGATSDEIQKAARLADIHHLVVGREQAYEDLVGERGARLSAGERQRIAIARALVKKPAIFVLDEATSSLDAVTERRVLQNFSNVSGGKTTLIIAHRLSTIAGSDDILVLKGGAIVERGSHRDLLQQSGVYHAMWAAQQAGWGSAA